MTTPENTENSLIKICLLDFKYDDLRKILDDESLSKKLTEYDESSALGRIDELINLHEAPIVGYLLNEKAVLDVREEWSITIPQGISNLIKNFLDKNR